MRIESDHFRLAICDNVKAPQTQAETDYNELTVEMETGSSDMLTLSLLNNSPPARELVAMALNKHQVGNLLAFLALLHQRMDAA